MWIDAVSHVTMGRDRRLYRFLKDTRLGRVVLAESHDMKPVADQVIRYVAERIVERDRMLHGDVMMVVICAALAAARIFVAPAVKLIIAGTRPALIKPRMVTTAPFAFGSMTPIARPSGASGMSLAPRTAAPTSRRL